MTTEDKTNSKVNKELNSITEYYLQTDGVNLISIMNNEYTESSKCISNDIIEIEKRI